MRLNINFSNIFHILAVSVKYFFIIAKFSINKIIEKCTVSIKQKLKSKELNLKECHDY